MTIERALCLLVSIALAACADTNTKVETETHFLRSCESSCEDGLDCICGVCTTPCSEEAQCAELSGSASCAPIPSSCGHVASTICDVTCTESADCAALGAGYTCGSGRCRADSDAGAGGTGGSGGAGAGGSGGAGSGGAGGGGGQGGSGASDGGPVDAEVDGGADASTGGDCDAIGDACCDPFPGDGPNYCNDVRLQCGGDNTCQPNCDCPLGAYVPACGDDGQTYDATCGDACVPVAIACRGECPCDSGYCAVTCTGAAPDQEAIDACSAVSDEDACTSLDTGSFPMGCRWVRPGDTCPPFP